MESQTIQAFISFFAEKLVFLVSIILSKDILKQEQSVLQEQGFQIAKLDSYH